MFKQSSKYILIIVIIVIISIAFTSSHSVQSVDDLAYAVALGIDVGTSDKLKVTFQFTMPNSSGESSSGETAPSVIDSVEASSIDSAISLMNTYVSKEINLSHCKVIAISEELAKQGIGTEIYTLMNKVQIRPDNYIVITRCDAQEYIKSVSPSLENLVAKFYEILPRSSEYAGYTINAQLGDFFNKLVCKTCEPTAILGNIATDAPDKSESSSSEGSSGSQGEGAGGSSSEGEGAGGSSSDSGSSGGSQSSSNSQGSGGSSNQPISAKNGIENIGVAVFKDDKLVGTLSAEETLAHLLLTDELKSCNISVPDPEEQNKKIDLYITSNNAVKIKGSIVNGTPYIKTNITINAKISSVDKTSLKMSEQKQSQIEQSANNYLKNLINNYLYKTSKEFHSDIAGLGKYVLSNFKTMNEFENYDWLNHYQDAFFETDAQVKISSGFLLTGT